MWVRSEGLDRRENTTLRWDFPYGFLDQSLSSPIRMPTPAGDYCYVFDVENREPADTRALRILDSGYCLQSIPHPFDAFTAVPPVIPTSTPTFPGGLPMSSPLDPNHMLLAYL
ncbi:MAG: oxidoreductase, partial [Mycolicibacterium sp.]|nr:oxidoreductase [Mycolicibacterium sp.]